MKIKILNLIVLFAIAFCSFTFANAASPNSTDKAAAKANQAQTAPAAAVVMVAKDAAAAVEIVPVEPLFAAADNKTNEIINADQNFELDGSVNCVPYVKRE